MKYAIIESGGKQYRAVEGGTIEVDRLPNEIGANVKLEQILLIADGDNISVGAPLLTEPVWTTVVAHIKGKKVTTFNYSPKKRIRVKTGHRQSYTRLAIEQIGGSEFKRQEPEKKAKKAAAAEAEEAAVVTEPEKKPAKKAAEKKPAEKKPAAKKSTAAAEPKKKTTTKAAPKKPAAKK